MSVEQGTQDVVFGINRYHLNQYNQGMSIYAAASSPSNYGNPWENTLNGHPSVQGKSNEDPVGHADGVDVWYDCQWYTPNAYSKVNCIGLVNMEWASNGYMDHEDLKVAARTTSGAGSEGADNLFNPSTAYRRVGLESSTGKTWMLQLTDVEHASPESPSTAVLRYVRLNYDSYPTAGVLRWVGVGEVFFGSLYHPPAISWNIDVRIRPSVVLARTRDGWAWEKRVRSATREYALRWEGLSIEEKIELEQFAMNAGNPWYEDEGGISTSPRPGLADFGSPMLMSLNQDGLSDDDVVVRNAMYVVVDPSSIMFRQNITGTWNGQMKFLEVV